MKKILALYLPQYHEFKENNEWWGNGYTEWTAVKKAKKLFKSHYQPKIPLNHNYYDLVKEGKETLQWQANLAKKYGIYGFCFYNYWFNGHQLMEKPLDILLKNRDIDINYCICWANETWTRTWYGLEKEILIEQKYGDEKEWEKHYLYLRNFFLDTRYIKVENKPMLCIYHTHDIIELDKMINFFNTLAVKDGFNGIYIVSGNTNSYSLENRDSLVSAYYNFEPGYTLKHKMNYREQFIYNSKVFINRFINKIFHKKHIERILDTEKVYKQMNRIIEKTKKPVYPGIFPQWDNTPRRSYKGLVYKNCSPEKFKTEMCYLLKRIKEGDFIFINAWNEWGEGAYLEPDEVNGYAYLEAIKKSIEDYNKWQEEIEKL